MLDGDGSAYGVDGIVLDCPATTIPELVEWTLRESGLGAAKLNRYGKDSDPLIVLTAAAAVRLGLPERLEGHEQRRSLRLPEDHPVVKEVAKARWQLTQRGFGPWARIYRKAQGRERQCVQLAILSWDALDERSWPGVSELEAADIARVLGNDLNRASYRALVTSRHALSTLPVHRIDLDPLSPEESVDLLDQALRAGSAADDRVTTQRVQALRLGELCGRLPLVLRIITALLRDEPERSLAGQARDLDDARTRLDAKQYDDLAVRASLDLSHQHLTEEQARAFRLLATAPGADIGTASAAVLLDRPPADGRRLLAELARTHLLSSTSERWSMHDLIRLYADSRSTSDDHHIERAEGIERLYSYYLQLPGMRVPTWTPNGRRSCLRSSPTATPPWTGWKASGSTWWPPSPPLMPSVPTPWQWASPSPSYCR
ncbi:hypothetical protein GCM10023084_62340 [Streptomyces lacrimifluminis]|uniref:Transcriptional regulator n=1 Tax=Streptomyces lacrimifluminis TaxID=1500077 RepID=A0A917NZY4_9ACTN|nr:hypothetical protein GCM10012282_47180 [Streptomyces lacrimifluminis]